MAFSSACDIEHLADKEAERELTEAIDAKDADDGFFELRGRVDVDDFRIPVRRVKSLLRILLQAAIGVELTTIPPYLTAMYSIKTQVDEKNDKGRSNIQNVVIEEMLHAGLAANILKAIGGHVEAYSNNLGQSQAYANYPVVGFFDQADDVDSADLKILPANEEALNAFVAIETEKIKVSIKFFYKGKLTHVAYDTIADFYYDIEHGLEVAENHAKKKGDSIFLASRKPEKQEGEELDQYYFEYPGLKVVRNLMDAKVAINTICWQGEGQGIPPPHETDPTHAQWFIETRDSLPLQTWPDLGNIGNEFWPQVNAFFNAAYSYQLMEFEYLYLTNLHEVTDGAVTGIAAKQKKAYFGMGVLMLQVLRPLSIFMQKNGAYPTYAFHEFQRDPVADGTPLDQLKALGQAAADAARPVNAEATSFLDEMTLSLVNVVDGISTPPPHINIPIKV